MLKRSEQRTEAFNIADYIQGDTGNKLIDAFKMFDTFSKSEYYVKFQKLSAVFVSKSVTSPISLFFVSLMCKR